jgi:hypothetical protein
MYGFDFLKMEYGIKIFNLQVVDLELDIFCDFIGFIYLHFIYYFP